MHREQIAQETLVEPEGGRMLPEELYHRVEELGEDWLAQVAAHPEAVAEGAPLLLDERREAVARAVVRVEHQLGKRAHLRRAVPAVGAMKHDAAAFLEVVRHLEACVEQTCLHAQPLRTRPGRAKLV